VLLTGSFIGTLDFSGGLDGGPLTNCSPGSCDHLCNMSSTLYSYRNLFVARLDGGGGYLWSTQVGSGTSQGGQTGYGLTVNDAGVFVTGSYIDNPNVPSSFPKLTHPGGPNILLMKLSP
jgi:hypothetical protein